MIGLAGIIRILDLEDEELMREFLQSLPKETLDHWYPFGKVYSELMLQKVMSGKHIEIVCIDKGKIVAFGHINPKSRSVGAVSLYPGKGYGSTIMEELIRIARAKGYKYLLGSILNSNPGALRFDLRFGFKVVRTSKDGIQVRMDLVERHDK